MAPCNRLPTHRRAGAAGWPPAEAGGRAGRRGGTASMTAPALGETVAHPDRSAAARHLLRRAAAPGLDGLVCGVDPESAGWDWTTFHVYRLRAGPARDAPRGRDGAPRSSSSRVTRPSRWGTATSASRARATSVFDGPPPPIVLVEPGLAVEIVADTERPRRRRGCPGRPRPADRAHRRRRHPGRGPRGGQHGPAHPPPAAAVRRGRPPHRLRGLHPGRQLVELPAAQARHGEPAGRGAPRGALLLQVREAGAGLRIRARLHAGPLARRGDDADGRRPRARAGGLPPGRRPGGLRLLLPQHHGRARTAPGTSPSTRTTRGS